MKGHLIKNNKKIVLLSLALACFNPNVLLAQITPVADILADTDTATDTTTDTTETPVETDNTATVILSPDTGGTLSTPDTSSSGGGGGAGILVLAAAGLLIANMSSKSKKPAIQKTFIETGVGEKAVLTEYRAKNFFEKQKSKGALSLQVGSDTKQYSSKSIVNFRWSRQLAGNLKFYSDLGSSWKANSDKNTLLSSDWLSVSLRQDKLFSKEDSLVLIGQLASTSINASKRAIFENQTLSNSASEYGSLLSEPSTRIELAYVRRLMDNQHLGFRLTVEKLSNDIRDSNASLLWQKRF